MSAEASAVLDFWLGPRDASPPDAAAIARWFEAEAALDAEIRARFGVSVGAALAGRLDAWGDAGASPRVALIVLLDQFPRNLFRDDPRAFAGDAPALRWARAAAATPIGSCHPVERYFAALPFMHAESLEAQREGVALFRRAAEEEAPAFRPLFAQGAGFAERHRVVIERFGRFPHRNAVLGRASTPEERAHLAAHPGGF